MTSMPSADPQDRTRAKHVRFAIIGAGFGGLGAAIRLQQDGEDDVLVFDRGDDVGGTWANNTYPGCQCDIPSHLYSFSFAPNPAWTRTYAKQPELRAYLRSVARRFGLHDRLRLKCEVTAAEWEEAQTRWRLQTTDGPYTATFLIAAPGPLSEPSYPEIPGLERFAGELMHTGAWRSDVELRGRRVAVVGTGASAIQVVPEIQQLAAHLDVYQRTPPWIVPHFDRDISPGERALYRRWPATQRFARSTVYFSRELLVPGLAYRPRLLKLLELVANRHRRTQVADPELRGKVTPSYAIGCKRILPSDKWYPALSAENVDLVTDGISEIRPDGVVTADGTVHPADVLVLATGFYVTDIPLAHRIRGADGRTMAEVWDRSPQAHRGTTVTGFPNLFFLVGPNTGLGHNSIVFMIEAQLNYVMEGLRELRRRGAGRLEVRADAQHRYNEELQSRMGRTVWSSGGCNSWYIDAKGRNTTIWPDFTFRFWDRMRRFDAEAYALTPARAGEPELAPAP